MSTSEGRSGWVYVALGVGLSAMYPFLANSGWMSGSTFHTVLEVAATIIAAGVGILALVRFYSQRQIVFLFTGTGFIGTALLDGYHALVTSEAIAVADNGIGFEPKYAERIFGVFKRLHGQGEFEGSGIGLAVCQRIVERHNGRIWADGVPGQGATFRVALPSGPT
jgi:K+-sensing histidine kinase KdpD